jgi:hypothetical protein
MRMRTMPHSHSSSVCLTAFWARTGSMLSLSKLLYAHYDGAWCNMYSVAGVDSHDRFASGVCFEQLVCRQHCIACPGRRIIKCSSYAGAAYRCKAMKHNKSLLWKADAGQASNKAIYRFSACIIDDNRYAIHTKSRACWQAHHTRAVWVVHASPV